MTNLLSALLLSAAAQDAVTIDQLVQRLGHVDPAKRDAAQAELLRIGAPARVALERAVASDDPEIAARARFILGTVAPDAWAFPEPPAPQQPDGAQAWQVVIDGNMQWVGQAIQLDTQALQGFGVVIPDDQSGGVPAPAIELYEQAAQGDGQQVQEALRLILQADQEAARARALEAFQQAVQPDAIPQFRVVEPQIELQQLLDQIPPFDPVAPPAPESAPAPQAPRDVPAASSDVIWV